MSALTPEKRTNLLIGSRPAAIAFVQDITHIHGLLDTDLTPQEIRRLSGIARRIFLDADITAIAAPRVGKINYRVPDLKSFYESDRIVPYELFAGTATTLSSVFVPPMQISTQIYPTGFTRPLPSSMSDWSWINLPLVSFMGQRVIKWRKTWITRREIIQHVAHVMSGVHSGTAETSTGKILSYISRTVHVSISKDKIVGFTFGFTDDGNQLSMTPSIPLSIAECSIDLLLLELLATLRILASTPDIQTLEEVIRHEVG